MSTLAIIPARKGSKRLPDKNKRDFAGQPLITYAIRACLAASRIDTVVVNTDDPDILALAGDFPEILFMQRPIAIAGDKAPAIQYVVHTLDQLPATDSIETIVIVQPTSPLTEGSDIDATLQLLNSTGADSAVSVMKLDHAVHPVKMKLLVGDKLYPYLEKENGRMATHELPDIYVRNCSVYATKRRIIEAGQIIGPDCRAYVMPRERSIDINDRLDFELALIMYQTSTHE